MSKNGRIWYEKSPKPIIQFGLIHVPFLDRNLCPKTELFCLVFGRCSNTEPSENGTEVNRPRTELIQILDVDCTISYQFNVPLVEFQVAVVVAKRAKRESGITCSGIQTTA